MGGIFRDRAEAGKQLAMQLKRYAQQQGVIVLGLPRGGILTAAEVARELNLPLDILLVRKLLIPGTEPLAIGAITTAGHKILNQQVILQHQISEQQIEAAEEAARVVLQARERRYRGVSPDLTLAGHTVILVDDGMLTGATMQVAVASLGTQQPARIIVAVPVASQQSIDALSIADELICLHPLEKLHSIAEAYKDFHKVDDDEVCDQLAAAEHIAYKDFDLPPFV